MLKFLLGASLFIAFLLCVQAKSSSKSELMPSICVNGGTKTRADYEADQASWIGCPWQRSDVIEWTGRGFDLNGDELIDEDEINTARHYYFEDYELIFGETAAEVLDHCDCDGDGFISTDDFLNSKMTCIRNCNKAREVWWFLGSRIANGVPYSGKVKPDAKDRPQDLDHFY